ncbi:unnamed protein product [Oreochromis niloticus]|nr:unnamed protein product [Mustela putorius furo]
MKTSSLAILQDAVSVQQTRPLYCRINLSVPVLDRFFNDEDTRPDFRLSRESLNVLLNLLNQDRRHGWGATIEAIRQQVIHLPRTPEEVHIVSHGFAELGRHRVVLKAAGAIDCCHVRMSDTYVGWPDGGYPCLQHPFPLITPYKRPVQGVGALRFNSYHSRARCIIERAFGMMKTRFRAIFLQAQEVHHTFVPHVVTACAILHNICLGVGDVVAPEDEPEDDTQDEGEAGLEAGSGSPWWDRLSAEVSALEEVPLDHDYC